MANKLVIEISNVELNEHSGMGRVIVHWKHAFEQHGYEFIHLGPEEIKLRIHRLLAPISARVAYNKLNKQADILLIHEPLAAGFLDIKSNLFILEPTQ